MFAYCGNNPVVYTDTSGSARYPCTVHINDSGMGVDHGTGFATPDEAAIAFADEWYDNHGGLEHGAVIVRFYKNGQPRYTYDMVAKGTRGHVRIDTTGYRDDYVHNGAAMVGDIHTHGTSNFFSPVDVAANNDMLSNLPNNEFYLAGNDGGVYKYNANNKNQSCGDYIGSFTPAHGLLVAGSTGSSPMINKFSLLR